MNFGGVCKADRGRIIAAGGCTPISASVDHGNITMVDPDGQLKWFRKVGKYPADSGNEYLYNVVALKDGTFVASGSSHGQDALGRWTQDGWLIRFDSNGCIQPEHCKDLGVSDNFLVRNNLNIYPNPTSGVLNLSREKPFPKESQVRLLDNQGRVLRALPNPAGRMKMSYHLKGLPPGVYYLEVTVKGYVQTQKVVLAR